MKTTVNIDIDNYLSEEDKRELAENLFKEELRKGFLEGQKEKRIDNYERVINNSVHYYLNSVIDQHLGTDYKERIEQQVKKVLSKNLTFTVFRSPSLWGDKKSRAQEIMDQAVEDNKELAKSRVKKAIEDLNLDSLDEYMFGEVLTEVIKEKLIS